MKKRLFAAALLLLAATLLFSSCAMGAFAPSFATVAEDRISNFLGNASNLLQNNVPLFFNGNVNFACEFQGECAEDASALLRAIQEKTGIDMYHGAPEGAPKLRVGLDLVADISRSEFFIGFVDGNLVITAKSKPMLQTALHYFEREFVMSENANAGEGFLYLPGKLSYKSPTVSIYDEMGVPNYTIVYPEGSDEVEFASVNLILNATSLSTTRLDMQTDLFSPESVKTRKEILVGLVDREETQKAAEGLNRFSYYLGITENKIIIVATNPWTLKTATQRFISLFANDLGMIRTLPAEFSYLVSNDIQ